MNGAAFAQALASLGLEPLERRDIVVASVEFSRLGEQWVGLIRLTRQRQYPTLIVVRGREAGAVRSELRQALAAIEAGEPLAETRVDLDG